MLPSLILAHPDSERTLLEYICRLLNVELTHNSLSHVKLTHYRLSHIELTQYNNNNLFKDYIVQYSNLIFTDWTQKKKIAVNS